MRGVEARRARAGAVPGVPGQAPPAYVPSLSMPGDGMAAAVDGADGAYDA